MQGDPLDILRQRILSAETSIVGPRTMLGVGAVFDRRFCFTSPSRARLCRLPAGLSNMPVSQAISRMMIWMKLSKKLTKPIRPEMELRIGLAGIDADLCQPSRPKELGGADGVAAGHETKVIVVAEDEPGSLNGDALDEYTRAWAEAVNHSGEGYLIVIRL